jgi:RHS repeat-associated protein
MRSNRRLRSPVATARLVRGPRWPGSRRLRATRCGHSITWPTYRLGKSPSSARWDGCDRQWLRLSAEDSACDERSHSCDDRSNESRRGDRECDARSDECDASSNESHLEDSNAIARYRAGDAGDPQALRLPGQEAPESGLSNDEYNIFRWYRAGWGRYTEADPLDATPVKRRRASAVAPTHYSYANADPVILTHRLGLDVGGSSTGAYDKCIDKCIKTCSSVTHGKFRAMAPARRGFCFA